MKYILNVFKFIFMLALCTFVGIKIFEFYADFVFDSIVLAQFSFVSIFVLTCLMIVYGIYCFICDLFMLKKFELSKFFDSNSKPQYD